MSSEWTAQEREYSPSSMVESLEVLEAEYRTMSAATRVEIPPQTVRFGDGPDDLIDLFLAGGDGTLHAFLHGGYWQALGKDDASFPARGFVERGVSYAAVNYTLAPQATLPEIIEQCRQAVQWLYNNAKKLGCDPERIVLSGSSAGAELAAMVALTDWSSRGLRGQPLKGMVLLSGVYDLRPLLGTYVNETLGMDEAVARACSPLLLMEATPVTLPAIVVWGEHETQTFKRESAALAEALFAGGSEVLAFEVAGRNHFNLVHDLSDPDTVLGRAVLENERKWTNGIE